VIVKVLVIGVLLLLNAFFATAEFALVRSGRAKLEAMVRAGDTVATHRNIRPEWSSQGVEPRFGIRGGRPS